MIQSYADSVTELLSLTVVYEPVENGWIQARIEELPGVITAGQSFAEAKELIVDAVREYLLALGTEQPEVAVTKGSKREPLAISVGV